MSKYTTYERGQLNTTSYRVFIKDSATNDFVSPFHDIPLLANKETQIYNAVIEIPRWSNAKMEISKTHSLNPIEQDVKKDKLRFVNNVFPYHGYPWNYGALPQTWEDPNQRCATTGCSGDNDPLDVCEIGARVHSRGSVVQVKVLGAIGLIDEGESDWKIIVIDVSDPLAAKLNDIADVEAHLPGLLDATRDWFRIYKVPTGKPANTFALNGKFFDREFALKQIAHDHQSWANLVGGGYDAEPEKKKGISVVSVTQEKSRVASEEAARLVAAESVEFVAEAAAVDRLPIDEVHYVDRAKI